VSLRPGARLGAYEIVSSLGEGGMGEVYRARDTRLDRTVAIKVLPEAFAADAQFRERFDREARTISQLNHPNICTLHDVGRDLSTGSGQTPVEYLVMELVDGETLEYRLKRGAIPIPELLPLLGQIASALEAAHEKGIVHRDLKPANIKITPDGAIKVLDFGLAKNAGGTPASESQLSMSPTMFAGRVGKAGMTGAGVILGTAAYMSPEQARGLVVDKRTDIWAFGCVLYEMLTGKPAFRGDTATDIIAAIVREEPDLAALPPTAPASIRRLLKRCLEKDRRRRLPDIAVVRMEIDDAATIGVIAGAQPGKQAPRAWVPWSIAAASILALVTVSWNARRSRPETSWSGTELGGPPIAMAPTISPDGQWLAFQVIADGQAQAAVMKPDTGNWTVLTRDRSHGGLSNICWARDGSRIYFDRWTGAPRGIYSVPILGGDEQLVVENAAAPQALPDGSMLIERVDPQSGVELFRYWPETRTSKSLDVLMPTTQSTPFRTTPAGDRVVFLGRRSQARNEPNSLQVLDLATGRFLPLAPGVPFAVGDLDFFALAADARSAFIGIRVDDIHRIVRYPLDGSADAHTILTLTLPANYLDVGADGSLYLDQWDRPDEILRLSSPHGPVEHLGVVPFIPGVQALPLPDGKILVNSRAGGRDRLMLMAPGKEPVPFIAETRDETAAPLTFVGDGLVAFLIGSKDRRTIALASLADRRIARRLTGASGAAIDSMVASPDGKTIYYAASGSIWSISVDDGTPQRLRTGQSITLDPYRNEFIVRMLDQYRPSLVQAPVNGGADRTIPLQGDMRPAPIFMQSNAVARDGRILAQVGTPASWFWQLGVIDPDSGRADLVDVGYPADVGGGWTPDGKLVLSAIGLRAKMWRFRPRPR
jgi:serine/threonine protein kinase